MSRTILLDYYYYENARPKDSLPSTSKACIRTHVRRVDFLFHLFSESSGYDHTFTSEDDTILNCQCIPLVVKSQSQNWHRWLIIRPALQGHLYQHLQRSLHVSRLKSGHIFPRSRVQTLNHQGSSGEFLPGWSIIGIHDVLLKLTNLMLATLATLPHKPTNQRPWCDGVDGFVGWRAFFWYLVTDCILIFRMISNRLLSHNPKQNNWLLWLKWH